MANNAQGTIEYLIIIAIVIVIGLIVTSIITTQLNSSEKISSTSSKIKTTTGNNELSITDSVAGADTNGLLILKNNNPSSVTINKIVVDGEDHNYNGEQIAFGEEKGFNLVNIIACDGSKKSYSVLIKYTSVHGISKIANFETIIIDCITVTPSGSVDENVSSEAVSLADYYVTGTLNPDATGAYNENGTYNGYAAYEREDGAYWIWHYVPFPESLDKWAISPSQGGAFDPDRWNANTLDDITTTYTNQNGIYTGTATVSG